MKKFLLIAGPIVLVIIIWIIAANQTPKVTTFAVSGAGATTSQNVSMDNDKQIIEINAKGGYNPTVSLAKANVPTVLRVKTSSTFDCSSSLRIPSLGYFKNLPPTGTTDIDIPVQQPGATLSAVCGMGMYNFSVQFKG